MVNFNKNKHTKIYPREVCFGISQVMLERDHKLLVSRSRKDTGPTSAPDQTRIHRDTTVVHLGVHFGQRSRPQLLNTAKLNKMVHMPTNAMAAPDLAMMDEIWNGEFGKVFQPYLPHIWYLSQTEMCPSPRWRRFKDSAKVRFCCRTCGHGWTSMKGRVVFWYFLNIPYYEGFVQFKLYGQQCQRCNNGMFEPAMWYPEEVNKVLCNLYNRIGQTYYGFVKPPIRYDRRAGKPRTQHNATLCQACRDGECDSRPRTTTPTSGHVASSPAAGTNKLQTVTG